MKTKIFITKAVTILLSMALLIGTGSGCGQREPHIYILGTSSSVYQGILSNNKVDILWVIDNSISMKSKQTNLANSFASFLTQFMQKSFDFHLAVVTTDTRTVAQGGQHGIFFNKTSPTVTPKIITNETEDPIGNIKTNIAVGMFGTTYQKPFEAVRLAFSEENLNGLNTGFLRDDAFLAVIVLTDGDIPLTYTGSNIDHNDITSEELIQHLDTIKPAKKDPKTGQEKKQYSVSGIVGDDLSSDVCKNFIANAGGFDAGALEKANEVIKIANETGGSITSICEPDFSAGLMNLSTGILKSVSNIKLSRAPDLSTMRITFNGQVVPNSETNGWSYNSADTSIDFHGDFIPGEQTQIDISFVPLDIVR